MPVLNVIPETVIGDPLSTETNVPRTPEATPFERGSVAGKLKIVAVVYTMDPPLPPAGDDERVTVGDDKRTVTGGVESTATVEMLTASRFPALSWLW